MKHYLVFAVLPDSKPAKSEKNGATTSLSTVLKMPAVAPFQGCPPVFFLWAERKGSSAFQIDRFSVNDGANCSAPGVKGVAVPEDNIGVLALFD